MEREDNKCIIYNNEDNENGGYSIIQLLKSAIISAHFVNLTNAIYLDMFNFKEYEPTIIMAFTQDFFKGDNGTVKSFNRY